MCGLGKNVSQQQTISSSASDHDFLPNIELYHGYEILNLVPIFCKVYFRVSQILWITEAFPQPLFRLTQGNTVLPRVGFFVSLIVASVTRCYPVAIETCTILVLHSLTPEKVGLLLSELFRLHHDVYNGSTATLRLFWLTCFMFTYHKTNS